MKAFLWYLDYLVGGAAIAGLAAARFGHVGFDFGWILLPIVGAFVWTLAEYALHRWVLHWIVPGVHDLHHAEPTNRAGNATSLSTIPSFLLYAAILYTITSADDAAGILIGTIAAYLWFVWLHDSFHRAPNWICTRWPWWLRARWRHLVHHYRDGNYGVVTVFWDVFFDTKPH